jgi:hypothetical protein
MLWVFRTALAYIGPINEKIRVFSPIAAKTLVHAESAPWNSTCPISHTGNQVPLDSGIGVLKVRDTAKIFTLELVQQCLEHCLYG